MNYSHTYEINAPGVNMEGKIVFNDGNEPEYTTDSAMCLKIKASKEVLEVIKSVQRLHDKCGGIGKVEFQPIM